MSNPIVRLPYPGRGWVLWTAFWRALQPLRPACARTSTFLWLVVVLAALCLRPDLAGVTSPVRGLGLSEASYFCLLHFFHSPALDVELLTRLWQQTLQGLAGVYLAVPVAARLHEGVVWSNRDRRTLLDKLGALLAGLSWNQPVTVVADAYYAAAKFARSLLDHDPHRVTRVRTTAVAYFPP